MITRTQNLIAAAPSNQASLLWSPVVSSQVVLAQTGSSLHPQARPLAAKASLLGLEERFEGQCHRNYENMKLEDKNYDYRTSGYFVPPIAFVDLHLGSCP